MSARIFGDRSTSGWIFGDLAAETLAVLFPLEVEPVSAATVMDTPASNKHAHARSLIR